MNAIISAERIVTLLNDQLINVIMHVRSGTHYRVVPRQKWLRQAKQITGALKMN
jgi:hypothetical protein